MLELVGVGKRVGAEDHIKDVTVTLEKGSLNILLGPTHSGKTSLMRLMAGLDRPTEGDIRMDGASVIGVPVQKRNVAMVYQEFINYPAMTVYENIASPLRIAGANRATVDSEVKKAAALLKLTPYLDRTPLSLSGGQQQRTALARAIVKNADLVLLDEPLANLDYKLREELRAELPRIFERSGAIFVYATTEPSEALLLGGNTAALSLGRVTQFGPTVEVFRHPVNLITAQTFSDPPMNTIRLRKSGGAFKVEGLPDIPVPETFSAIADEAYTVGFRPHHLSLQPVNGAAFPFSAGVLVTEITGSESYIHLSYAGEKWVMLTRGVHNLAPGDVVTAYLDTRHLMVFDQSGAAVAGRQRLAA